jgi:hypothetical protein
MPSKSSSLENSSHPEEPLHPGDATFFGRISEVLDGQPKDPAAVEAARSGGEGLLEVIAANLYRIASMLLGEAEESVGLTEQVVITLDLTACHDQAEANHQSRLALAAEAIRVLGQRGAAVLAAPVEESGPVSCIEDDDLDSGGVTPAELEQMLTGPDDHRLRNWLEGLSVTLRVIFVLRAVAGLSSAEVAGLLAERGGSKSQDWTPDAVRSAFRQALCSLASQLIHASAAR